MDEDGNIMPTAETMLRAMKLVAKLTGWSIVADANGGVSIDCKAVGKSWHVYADGTAEERKFFAGRLSREPVTI